MQPCSAAFTVDHNQRRDPQSPRMNASTILWIYIVLLVLGGVMGYLKARSTVSLYTSVGFAAALTLAAVGLLPLQAADWIMAALIIVFAFRFAKTRRVMPAGFMVILTILALAARHLL
jgi:uncharacterized membrane protein (UPF0136 family)